MPYLGLASEQEPLWSSSSSWCIFIVIFGKVVSYLSVSVAWKKTWKRKNHSMFNFQICAYLRWLLSSRLQLEEQTVLPQTKLSLLLWLRIFMCWKLGYYILGSAQQKSTLLELILNSEHHPPVSWFYDFLVNKMVLFPWEGDMLRNFDLRKGHIVLKKSLFIFGEHFPLQICFISCHVTEIKVLCVWSMYKCKKVKPLLNKIQCQLCKRLAGPFIPLS